MVRYNYDRLTALDNSFLVLEGPNHLMHVGMTPLFEAGPLATKAGGVDIDRIMAYVESRLPLIPRYRQRLAYIPIEQHPVWIDDARFNLHYHVRQPVCPRPATSGTSSGKRHASRRKSSTGASRSGKSGSWKAWRAAASR